MKRLTILSFLLALIFAFSSIPTFAVAPLESKVRRSANPISGRYIVIYSDEIARTLYRSVDVGMLSVEISRSFGSSVDRLFVSSVKGYSAEMTAEQADLLSLDPRIKYIEEDTEIFSTGTQLEAPWGLDRIDQHLLPMQGSYVYTATGNGVNAYVIDSGIRYSHLDFGGRAQFAFDAFDDGQAGNDCYGHGTHVAGTIGGATYGVAKGVNLFSLRVLNCSGSGSLSGIIGAIDWVTANHVKPAVANISITAGGISPTLDDSITASIAAGVSYTIASANNAADACLFSPGRTPNAMTVGAMYDADARAGFSNYGLCVDIFAPGYGILSDSIASDTATAIRNGTSMAAPHAAGVAALFLEKNPYAWPADVTNAMKAGATPNILTNVGEGSPNLMLFSLVVKGSEPIANIIPSDGLVYIGFPRTINWSNVGGFNSDVTIELSTDGGQTYPITIATDLPNTGTYTWTVPDLPTSQARIRVREFGFEEPSGTSNGDFVICLKPTAADIDLAGRVTQPDGTGVARAVVTLTDANGQSLTAITGSFGYFIIEGVTAGETYTAAAMHKRYRFRPRLVTVNDGAADVDFVTIE